MLYALYSVLVYILIVSLVAIIWSRTFSFTLKEFFFLFKRVTSEELKIQESFGKTIIVTLVISLLPILGVLALIILVILGVAIIISICTLIVQLTIGSTLNTLKLTKTSKDITL